VLQQPVLDVHVIDIVRKDLDQPAGYLPGAEVVTGLVVDGSNLTVAQVFASVLELLDGPDGRPIHPCPQQDAQFEHRVPACRRRRCVHLLHQLGHVGFSFLENSHYVTLNLPPAQRLRGNTQEREGQEDRPRHT
jgi:hypothetical protein